MRHAQASRGGRALAPTCIPSRRYSRALAPPAAASATPPEATRAAAPRRLLLAGASSPLGLAVARQFAAAGWAVAALWRAPPAGVSTALLFQGGTFVGDLGTDATLAPAALAAFRPHVVLCCVGSPPGGASCAQARAASSAVAALAAATAAASAASGASSNGAGPSSTSSIPGRFVLVSALGVGDSAGSVPAVSRDALSIFLGAKSLDEDAITAACASLPHGWVVLRPGPLTGGDEDDGGAAGAAVATPDDSGATGAAVATPDAGGAFSPLPRASLAHVALAAAVAPNAAFRRFAVLDPSALVISTPQLRGLEPWEALPFEPHAFDDGPGRGL